MIHSIPQIIVIRNRKDSLEGALDRVLFATELEFRKIPVPRLPQNTSNVNIDCARKSKQLHSLCDQPLEAVVVLGTARPEAKNICRALN